MVGLDFFYLFIYLFFFSIVKAELSLFLVCARQQPILSAEKKRQPQDLKIEPFILGYFNWKE